MDIVSDVKRIINEPSGQIVAIRLWRLDTTAQAGDRQAADDLLRRNLPLVRYFVGRARRHTPASITSEEMESAA